MAGGRRVESGEHHAVAGNDLLAGNHLGRHAESEPVERPAARSRISLFISSRAASQQSIRVEDFDQRRVPLHHLERPLVHLVVDARAGV